MLGEESVSVEYLYAKCPIVEGVSAECVGAIWMNIQAQNECVSAEPLSVEYINLEGLSAESVSAKWFNA